MSESEQNKSEQATPYKLEQARKKGMVAKSTELGALAAVGSAAVYLAMTGDELLFLLARTSARIWEAAGAVDQDGAALIHWLERLLTAALKLAFPLFSMIFFVVLAFVFMQNGFIFAPAALKPDIGRISPVKGIKRLFSLQIIIDAGKSFFKMAVYLIVSWNVISDYVRTLSRADLEPIGIAQILGKAGLHLGLSMLIAAAVFAGIDQVIVRRMFARQMRMSRHELKQEFKQREGDPRIKQRRRQLQQELLKRAGSASGVRQADVVVTNPTHYLVGLRYDSKSMSAPKIVAKGSGDFAQRLRKIAFLHGIPIVQSPSLARQLFFKAAQDQEVPQGLFGQVAEVYLKLRSRAVETSTLG